MKFLFYIFLIIIFIFQIDHSYGIENETKENDDDKLLKVLEKWWMWWSNTPEDHPDIPETPKPICSIDIDTEYSFVFLQDPFDMGKNSYDCTGNIIPKSYSILFPLLTSFCSQGDNGLVGKSYEEIRDCTLNLNRGAIKGNVLVDGKEIVNIFINNGNGMDILSGKKVIQNSLQPTYYKEIFSKDFIKILATNETTYKLNWANPDEFKHSPVIYKGVIYCDCIIINMAELKSGIHTIEYRVSAVATNPSPNLMSEGWNFNSNTIYKFTIQ
jgi:hypothetical protein